ncbi:hypothetical protein [Candidatus Pantoea multigeneris]|uniref:Uncharacterized protein n=1 Tax=Candidatus Pantoea multigeneris TaxID=2608357 RepID=A0ABX0RDR6_9GAMM|nr:hypothetical protein [Pantoea multigeneris]NIF21819.1 hypothetical protein [Pantoea multigeneris]
MDKEQIEQINELALALTQEQLDAMEIKITLGFLTLEHALMIEQTKGKVLNWIDWFKNHHNNLTNRFTLSVSSKGRPPMVIGAAVFSYDINNHAVNIHMVEHFKGIAFDDPLINRMGFVVLNVGFVFAKTVQATHICIINPLADAKPYYQYLTFEPVDEGVLSASLASIKDKLASLHEMNGQHDYKDLDEP